MATYLGIEVEPLEDYKPMLGEKELRALDQDAVVTPGDENWVWCRWPDGRVWKHWREQLG